ncbi:DUF6349 family protein [Streptomyces sp. NPDC026294]|uniref:DUF6349 family protein n=1 Tax=Streptomyces sp. NPDC026294 TaxID=3155362 RepID=UPI003401CAD9
MTAPLTEPTGARARQTYYWRVRNARTRALAKQCAAQTWHIQPGHPGGAYCDLGHELDPPGHHAPTLLTRSRPGRRDEQEFRGGCLACGWEGPVHRGRGYGDGDNSAIEDAHDHAFPGWRALPAVAKAQGVWGLARSERLWRHITVGYPPGWTGAGAPLLVRARYCKEPHDPPYERRPRYELRVSREDQQATAVPTEQKTLF